MKGGAASGKNGLTTLHKVDLPGKVITIKDKIFILVCLAVCSAKSAD